MPPSFSQIHRPRRLRHVGMFAPRPVWPQLSEADPLSSDLESDDEENTHRGAAHSNGASYVTEVVAARGR